MRKSERLNIRILPADKLTLEEIARMQGEAVAVVVRRLIRAEAVRCGLPPSERFQYYSQEATSVR